MDKIADDLVNNANNSQNVYKMHDSNTFTLDVLCVNSSNNNNNNNNNNNSNNNNNNNNEKMDDANQTTTTKTTAGNQKLSNTKRQDSTNSDFSPLTDSIQMNTDERHMNSIEFRADDEYSINDNQSNTSDEASDNNSTDNISFSEDIVENIIVLPNNFLSDDESTNSDDIVYAYRGFEPAQINADVNADEETDYLEMDFEPDPASEIEQEPDQSIQPNCSHMGNLSPQNPMHNTHSMKSNNESGVNTLSDLNIERTGVHKNWLAPIDCNGIYTEVNTLSLSNRNNRNTNGSENGGARIANNNNKIDLNVDSMEKESNKSLDSKRNANKIADVNNADAYSTYYDNTVSLSTKKYTGTIPKTSKFHNRPIKSKTAASDIAIGMRLESLPSSSMHNSLDLWPNTCNQTHKRWKISNREKPTTSSSSICDMVPIEDVSCTKRPNSVARSISFPNEDLSDQRAPSPHIFAFRCEPTCERDIENDVEQTVSVTFESTYCTIDTIVNALEKIHVLPNLRTLQKALRDGEGAVPQMNIPEYLVYASKRYCNYKAIVAAIEQSCDDVEVKCYLAPDGPLETVNIPLRMIASRLQTNGSLSNILTIKNKRFHQMNVLGKIVNMIRRFPNMRDDLIHNEFITIPQYYRSGVICVKKKQPLPNQT